jgi:DNA polymerase-2
MKAFVTYPTYKVIEDTAYIYLFGRLQNGKSFLAVNEVRPYFYIKEKDVKTAEKHLKAIPITGNADIEKTDFVNFDKEQMARVLLQIPKEVPTVRKQLENNKIRCYEADVRFEYRFMMDHGIKGTTDIIGKPVKELGFDEKYDVDVLYLNPEYKETWYEPTISVLSFDIETDRYAKRLFSIAIYHVTETGSIVKENIIVKDKKVKNAKQFSEKEALEYFAQKVRELDPDLITGWNVVDFDLKVLQDKFREHKIPFELGRVNWSSRITIMNDFMKTSRADIPGRMVVDGIDILKNNFIKLTDYKLDTAASEILEDKKLINDVETKVEVIERMYEEEPEKLMEYNAKDAELVINILNNKKLIELIIKRSMLTGMPLDRVQASVATLDSLYIRAARERKIVCSSVNTQDKAAPGKGGYVMEPKAGIYDNVLVLDFKSLYPSIMITFNIDPLSLTTKNDKHKDGLIEAPNGAFFRKEEGILSGLIKELMEHREEMKKKKDDIASYAIKIIMNSFYGALGNAGCRFFSMDISNAITYFGQYIIQNTAKEIKKRGYDVLYSDTDSVFIETKTKKREQAEKIGEILEKEMNEFYKGWVKKNYGTESALYLEFEKNYLKIIFPSQRGEGNKGAKKRYAGILIKNGKEKMDFTGLEFVRRDWTELSKKFQLELLDRVFHEKPVLEFVKNFQKDIKAGKYDDLMIYVKGLRKDLSSYTKTTPPHVKAARKLDKLDSNVIKYVMTLEGPEPVQNIEHPLDYEHYIDKQIRPIADSILSFFDTNLEELTKGSKQKELFDY